MDGGAAVEAGMVRKTKRSEHSGVANGIEKNARRGHRMTSRGST